MNLLEGFENYSRATGRQYGPRVSISASGWISINTTAYKKLGLSNYKSAEFYYNRENKMVGIKFVTEKVEGAYEMKPRGVRNNEKALYMSIKGFVQNYQIVEKGKNQKYNIFKEETEGNALIVLLKPVSDSSL
ncbi:MAG: hypothetical protein IJ016_02380 [Elusimicrobiaceae bacterium]|nr:hypothetical protein [Elusimicrobiaceae bacterium]